MTRTFYLLCLVFGAGCTHADDLDVVIPKDAGTDQDVSAIAVVLDRAAIKKESLGVWSDVDDDVPKEVLIAVDGMCYSDKLGTVNILKRFALYGGQGRRFSKFVVHPTGARKHPEKQGYQIRFVLQPELIVTEKKVTSLGRRIVEEWHYADDGTLSFERIVKAIGINDGVSFEK